VRISRVVIAQRDSLDAALAVEMLCASVNNENIKCFFWHSGVPLPARVVEQLGGDALYLIGYEPHSADYTTHMYNKYSSMFVVCYSDTWKNSVPYATVVKSTGVKTVEYDKCVGYTTSDVATGFSKIPATLIDCSGHSLSVGMQQLLGSEYRADFVQIIEDFVGRKFAMENSTGIFLEEFSKVFGSNLTADKLTGLFVDQVQFLATDYCKIAFLNCPLYYGQLWDLMFPELTEICLYQDFCGVRIYSALSSSASSQQLPHIMSTRLGSYFSGTMVSATFFRELDNNFAFRFF